MTVNIGNLARGTGGSMLLMDTTGQAGLGVTEFVKVATAPTVVNGIVPAVFATQSVAGAAATVATSHGDFVNYDNTNGFVLPTYYTGTIDAAAATDVVSVNASDNLTVGSKSISASARRQRIGRHARSGREHAFRRLGAQPGHAHHQRLQQHQ